jgi:hypothetical protein
MHISVSESGTQFTNGKSAIEPSRAGLCKPEDPEPIVLAATSSVKMKCFQALILGELIVWFQKVTEDLGSDENRTWIASA